MKNFFCVALVVLMAACSKNSGVVNENESVSSETTALSEESMVNPPFATITVQTDLRYLNEYRINVWYTAITSSQVGELYDEFTIDMIKIVYDNDKIYLMLSEWEAPNINNYGPYDYLTILPTKLESFDEFGGDYPRVHSFEDLLPEIEGAEYAYIEEFKFTVTDGATGGSLDFTINDNDPSIVVDYTSFRSYRVSFDPSPYYLR
ncbi:MAG: hypothetical protein LIO79_10835 [Rikenellaceae bacterium]|nr:hypothetical protein [Rikenellaceae bacterium]